MILRQPVLLVVLIALGNFCIHSNAASSSLKGLRRVLEKFFDGYEDYFEEFLDYSDNLSDSYSDEFVTRKSRTKAPHLMISSTPKFIQPLGQSLPNTPHIPLTLQQMISNPITRSATATLPPQIISDFISSFSGIQSTESSTDRVDTVTKSNSLPLSSVTMGVSTTSTDTLATESSTLASDSLASENSISASDSSVSGSSTHSVFSSLSENSTPNLSLSSTINDIIST